MNYSFDLRDPLPFTPHGKRSVLLAGEGLKEKDENDHMGIFGFIY